MFLARSIVSTLNQNSVTAHLRYTTGQSIRAIPQLSLTRLKPSAIPACLVFDDLHTDAILDVTAEMHKWANLLDLVDI